MNTYYYSGLELSHREEGCFLEKSGWWAWIRWM